MSTFIDEVVILKDIIQLWINGCWCMIFRMFKYVCQEALFNNVLYWLECFTYDLVFRDDSSTPTIRFARSNQGIE